MSQSCAITTCKRVSRALCNCCHQNLCRDHLNEHDDLLNAQLNPLADGINKLGDQLTTISAEQILSQSHEKLNQWRQDAYKTIDHLYEQKYEEVGRFISQKIHEQQEEIVQNQFKIGRLMHEREATVDHIDALTLNIQNIEEQIKEIEQIPVRINIRPLVVDDSIIDIVETNPNQLNLSNLPPVYQTIKRSDNNSRVLATND
ncbi:unnamed protein product [Didymodactylos carnosus]|uniref:Uncharacterized protein n=1 Tax=Didymodactylos carnosus TaxID=1234261 RepID=A0A815VTE3_9BILA|nr:unnamed protein product [Didymodactylos carnosus]CAF1536306.1 unnamed protein product [Didymodactylos carnosus]CAF3520006.1 unnamed protein product [Didymodactylos carnosus]CAF4396215.1 unnamed protein product [Didymodactylos carnosus]